MSLNLVHKLKPVSAVIIDSESGCSRDALEPASPLRGSPAESKMPAPVVARSLRNVLMKLNRPTRSPSSDSAGVISISKVPVVVVMAQSRSLASASVRVLFDVFPGPPIEKFRLRIRGVDGVVGTTEHVQNARVGGANTGEITDDVVGGCGFVGHQGSSPWTILSLSAERMSTLS